MGLDKWIKLEETDKIPEKKKTTKKQVKKSISDKRKEDTINKKPLKLVKYSLICKNSKCKYQKTIVNMNKTDPRTNPAVNPKIMKYSKSSVLPVAAFMKGPNLKAKRKLQRKRATSAPFLSGLATNSSITLWV